jgi:hypothetical protein
VVKFLPLIFVPVYFANAARRWRWMAGLILGVIPIYGAFALKRLPVLKVFADEGGMKSAGNLPFLVEAVSGVALNSRVCDAFLFLVFGVIFSLVFRTERAPSPALRMRVLTFGIAATTLGLLLFAKKSWPPYLLLALFPICAVIPFNRISVYVFALFNVVAIAEQSIWATLMRMSPSEGIHARLKRHDPAALMFLLLELSLQSGYGWLLWEAILRIRYAAETDSAVGEFAPKVAGALSGEPGRLQQQ